MTFILSIGNHLWKIGTTLWWHQTITTKSFVRTFFYLHTKNGIAACNIRRCFPSKNAWILNQVQFVSDLQIFPIPADKDGVIPIIYKRKVKE